MATCAVSGCKNNQRKTKNVHFYRFPKDPELCEKWVQFCNSTRVLNTKNGKSSSH